MWRACYDQVEVSHQELANWRVEDFETVIDGDTVVGSDRSKDDQIAADKATLQNYGRPYGEQGRPSGTYYRYATKERVAEWQDIDSRKMSQASLPGAGKLLQAPGKGGSNLSEASTAATAVGRLWRFVHQSVTNGSVASLRESGRVEEGVDERAKVAV